MTPPSQKIITQDMMVEYLNEKIKEVENELTSLNLELEFELSLPK